ncbi:MAG TPA: TetR/AcrR family transcriptional regulator [Thermomicrobiales bacterium]|nr:TetR/AcrR family transcriptional regulator [Thermomicrobiales bacterium]
MTATTPASAAGGRERILLQAYDKFIEQGFAAVSMQQIADAAGVNKATLYHHFRDKEDLFFEVVRLGLARSNESMMRAIGSGPTLREKLLALAVYLFGSERSDLNRLSGDMHQHIARERHDGIWKDFLPPWDYLAVTIREAIDRGEIAPVDPEVASRVCFTTLIGQVQLAKFSDIIAPPDEALAEQVVDILLRGLEPR